MKKRLLLIAVCLLLLAGSGCAGAKMYSKNCFAMDTYVTMSAHGGDAEAALNTCEYELNKLEKLFSPTLAASDAQRIDAANGDYVIVAHETAEMLQTAKHVSALTQGAFDVTVGPLVKLWGFETEQPAVPSDEAIAAACALVDYKALAINDTSVRLAPGMCVSLGGIGKGAAADRMCEILHAHGVDGAMLSLGGNVQTIGTRPNGADWRIAVQDPASADRVVGVIEAHDAAVVTSGAYQRGFTEDGVYYHHILDPKTGRPSDSGLISATAVAESGAFSDALSTALFVLGEEKALALYRAENSFEMILVTADGRVLYTEGLSFAPAEESAYRFEAVTR